MPNGETIAPKDAKTAPVAERFNADTVKEALREAQASVPGTPPA